MFGVVGLAAVLTRAELTANAIPVPVLVALVGMVLLRWLVRRLVEWQATGRAPAAARRHCRRRNRPGPASRRRTGPSLPGRRRFLQALGGTAAGRGRGRCVRLNAPGSRRRRQ